MNMPGMKRRLRGGETLAGFVATIPSAVSVQAMAAAGADWVVIDQEHGAVGPESLHAMVAATQGTRCAALVRVPRRDEAWVKPALDLGAEGIVFPRVRAAGDAAECVALTRYPPRGRRGWGPFAAHARWGVGLQDYLPRRGDETVCILLIETSAAVEQIEEICRVEGVDGMVVAQFDLAVELGVPGRFDAPEFRDAFAHLERVILEAGIPLGAAALTREQTRGLLARGHRLPVHGFDVLMLAGLVRQAAEWRRHPETEEAPTLATELRGKTGASPGRATVSPPGGASDAAGEITPSAVTDTLARSADATGAAEATRQMPEPDSLGG
jgi:4-hydroxy-2-oxoheptanedioate aldolase